MQSPHWYAVNTKPRAEETVLRFMTLREIPAYMPRIFVHHRHGSRRWEAIEPLFPSYLFVRVVAEPRQLEAVQWTPGVKQLLWSGTDPAPVPDEIILYLQDRVGGSGVLLPDPQFVPGVRVRLRSGPLAHLEGIIERPTSRAHRVRVLLYLLNSQVSVEIDEEDLERL
jgi:transcriptional antiterminator RfaH